MDSLGNEDFTKARIEVVIFDIGGVLVEHDNAKLFQQLSDCCCLQKTSAHAIHELIMNSGLRTGKQSVPDIHAALVRNFGFRGNYNDFYKLWVGNFKAIPESLEIVRQLHGCYRLFILSDTNEEHWLHVSNKYIDLDIFEHIFLSHRLGMAKPDPRLFKHVLEVIGCPPSHCVFIDDKPKNVEAARSFGLNGYFFESASDLRVEFARLKSKERE